MNAALVLTVLAAVWFQWFSQCNGQLANPIIVYDPHHLQHLNRLGQGLSSLQQHQIFQQHHIQQLGQGQVHQSNGQQLEQNRLQILLLQEEQRRLDSLRLQRDEQLRQHLLQQHQVNVGQQHQTHQLQSLHVQQHLQLQHQLEEQRRQQEEQRRQQQEQQQNTQQQLILQQQQIAEHNRLQELLQQQQTEQQRQEQLHLLHQQQLHGHLIRLPHYSQVVDSSPLVDARRDGSDYHFSWRHGSLSYSWLNANAYCNSLGTNWHPLSVETTGESNFIENLLGVNDIPGIWSAGYRSGNVFRWLSGEIVLNINWSTAGVSGQGQPDNEEGNENCLAILNNFLYDGIKWHDRACHYLHPVICERHSILLD